MTRAAPSRRWRARTPRRRSSPPPPLGVGEGDDAPHARRVGHAPQLGAEARLLAGAGLVKRGGGRAEERGSPARRRAGGDRGDRRAPATRASPASAACTQTRLAARPGPRGPRRGARASPRAPPPTRLARALRRRDVGEPRRAATLRSRAPADARRARERLRGPRAPTPRGTPLPRPLGPPGPSPPARRGRARAPRPRAARREAPSTGCGARRPAPARIPRAPVVVAAPARPPSTRPTASLATSSLSRASPRRALGARQHRPRLRVLGVEPQRALRRPRREGRASWLLFGPLHEDARARDPRPAELLVLRLPCGEPLGRERANGRA